MAAHRSGKPRGSGRPWRVRAYGPSRGFPRGRVVYRDGDEYLSRTPSDTQSLDDLFEQVERALDLQVGLRPTTPDGGRRDLNALAQRYYEWLKINDRDPDYINNRQCLLDVHFLREHGTTLVSRWSPTLSAKVVAAAREKVSIHRVEDLGVALSGMRKTAWRPDEDNERWLSPDQDPLEGVQYSKGSRRRTGTYVPRSARTPPPSRPP